MAEEAVAEGLPNGWEPLLAAAAIAGVAAYACIRAFIALIDRTGMTPYVIYRIALGLVLLVLWFGLWR
jgi:undecaprenyl-diphosphatase